MGDHHEDSQHRLATAYGRMLARLQEALDRADGDTQPRLGALLDGIRDRMVELGELSREEAALIADYLARDLQEAAQFIVETGEDLRRWWRLDVDLAEQHLFRLFSQVADQTSLQLRAFVEQTRPRPSYRAGEIGGPGVLVCTRCGAEHILEKAGTIPTCPRCGGGEFQRLPESGGKPDDGDRPSSE